MQRCPTVIIAVTHYKNVQQVTAHTRMFMKLW